MLKIEYQHLAVSVVIAWFIKKFAGIQTETTVAIISNEMIKERLLILREDCDSKTTLSYITCCNISPYDIKYLSEKRINS